MKFPGLFKRNPRPQQPAAAHAPAEPLDGLVAARQQAYERFRARTDPAAAPPSAQAPVGGPPATQAAPSDRAALDAAIAGPQIEAPTEAAPVAIDPLAGLGDNTPLTYTDDSGEAASPAPAEGGDPLDPSLLDIFRDAKQETEESSLAGEVEEVSITDLLAEITTISAELGIDPNRKKTGDTTDVAPPVPAVAEAAEELPVEVAPVPPPIAQVLPAQAIIEPEPEEEPVLETRPVVVIQRPQPPEPQDEAAPAEAPSSEPVEANAGSDGPRRFLLHVLFFGLALGLGAAGVGVRTVDGGALVAAEVDSSPTPAVLAFLRPPAIPTTEIGASHDEHAGLQATAAPVPETPVPSPDAVQTPTPTPEPRISMPPFFYYTVESGDSYTSISRSLEMCPDHIFWANPELDENDSLYVGQRLLLPASKGLIYVARRDDTLDEVAARYRSTAEAIADLPENHIDVDDSLEPGKALLIPNGVPPTALEETDLEHDMTRDPSADGFVWPFYGPITTYYGEERPGYTHYAIDIGGLFKFGAPVRAVADGRVSIAQWGDGDFGNYVVITHDDGTVTKYAHLDSIWVEQGDRVDQSDPLGPIGCTGASTGTHLHFEMYINGTPVDPLAYLR